MSDIYDGSIKIDTSLEYEKLDKAVNNLKNKVNSSAQSIAGGFNKMSKESEELIQELDNLNATIEVHQRELDNLERSYKDVAKQQGASSPAALKLQKQILSTEKSIKNMIGSSNKMAQSLWEMDKRQEDATQGAKNLDKALGKTASSIKDTGDAAEGSKKGISVMQVALADLASRGIQMAISGLMELSKNTQEFRRDMSKLETNAQLAGVSIEKVDEAMRHLSFVTGEADSNIEAISNLLQAGFDDNNLQAAIENLSGAVIQFPDTLKIESLADSLQETLATGEATGQFGEMLERLGVNLEDFEKGLKRATQKGKEQQYVLQEMAKYGLADVNQAYKENNESLYNSAAAQYDLNKALADLGEILEPIATLITERITQALEENKGAFEMWGEIILTIVDAVSGLFIALSLVDPQVLSIIATIIIGISVFSKMMRVVSDITDVFGKVGDAVNPVNSTLIRTTAIVLGVVIAFTALAAIIAVIMGKSAELDRTFNSINNSTAELTEQVNNVQRPRGYYKGSLSVPRGMAWVGERGPELVNFRGGERVYTAQQSQALIAAQKPVAPINNNYYVSIDASRVQEFNDIIRIAQNERMSIQKGYVGW